MKHLATLLSLLLIAGSAFAQRGVQGGVTNFQRNYVNGDSVTLDSTTVDTLSIQLPNNRGKAVFAMYVMLDDISLNEPGDATHDSIEIKYRPRMANTSTSVLYQSDGTRGLVWKDLQIYNGVNQALVDWDYTTTGAAGNNWGDSVYYKCVFDLDGYPWRYIDVLFSQTANDCLNADGVTADCTKIKIYFDID